MLSRRFYWLLYLCAFILLCLPLITSHYVPLVDYPSHLARAYIQAHYSSIPLYRQRFVITHELLPNLAVDLIAGTLMRFLSVPLASRIFLALLVLLFVLGCHLLGATIRGRPSGIALLCAFGLYNSMLLYGFVNYIFGLGMFCITFAYFLRRRQAWTRFHWIAVAVLVFLSYLSHQSAYAFLAIGFAVISAFDVHRSADYRRAVVNMMLLLPELLLHFTYRHTDVHAALNWGSLRQRLIGAFPLFTYNYRFDLLFVLALLALIALAVFCAKSRTIQLPTLAVGLLFFVLYWIAPYEWLGGSAVAARFMPPALLLIVLSLEFRPAPRILRICLAACLLLFILRTEIIWRAWRALDPEIAAQVGMLHQLPVGATVYVVFPTAEGGFQVSKTDRAFLHVPEYATITRQALIPIQFAIPGQQPVLFRSPPDYPLPTLGSTNWVSAMHHYDFAWSFAVPGSTRQVLRANCAPIAQTGKGTLWQVMETPDSTWAK